MKPHDTSESINQFLERESNLPPYETFLIECCERACMKPLRDLTPSDIVALLRNEPDALTYLVPKALEILSNNPVIFGRQMEGDLFAQVLRVPKEYWRTHEEDWSLAYLLITNLEEAVGQIWPVKDAFLSIEERAAEPTRRIKT
ncbi:hypothetical protein ALP8811_01987 [Aliiroseovarius pelagivivens]|uniref:Uncharacterized protein n=1 Tax=Aliiroseovarius pelagivivens TaxID=1639690 RepID=A0A2R8ALU3_9RHOB|nr:contact-dependent growth inhibition system immunity protein [Aliiroseovarius pelagivivens]SPF76970.1 hypothetical protein ALP8811_01987 [Aliiroseovarius pelagivivens]